MASANGPCLFSHKRLALILNDENMPIQRGLDEKISPALARDKRDGAGTDGTDYRLQVVQLRNQSARFGAARRELTDKLDIVTRRYNQERHQLSAIAPE